jgi:hypothetical protein
MLVFLLVMATSAVAQRVAIELVTEQDSFLPNEPLYVGVRITNRSGQPVILGQEEDWVKFSVFGQKRMPVAKAGDPAGGGIFVVPSASQSIKWFDLAPFFEMNQIGPYTLSASVKVKQWNEVIIANPPKTVNVVKGVTIAEQEFGVPTPLGSTQPPELRKYILQQVRHPTQLRFYVRVTDDTGFKIFGVTPIGALVSFSKPEFQIDQAGRLHVLHQNGGKTFNYCVVNHDGGLAVRQTYEYTTRRPALLVDEIGRLGVAGGRRKPAASDIPAALPSPEKSVPTNNLVLPR